METFRHRKIYLKEYNCFAEEIDVELKCKNPYGFFKILDIETLKRILQTAIEKENYELANLIKNFIENELY